MNQQNFQINLRGLIEILANHLYSRPEVFVRELLQNAVDAITARTKLQPDHTGEITFELAAPKGKPPTLVVTDNGVGMDEREIHRFLATIGESSKKDPDGKKIEEFLGQFGIGLLSCFVVSDEIVVVTKSARGDAPPVEWRGRADGTYGVRTLEGEFSPGTRVYLTCREGSEELFAANRIKELTTHYGGLLPYPIQVTTGRSTSVINADGAPWRRRYRNAKEQARALLEFGREAFGTRFLDAAPLHSKSGGVDGVAFILPEPPSLAARRTHRVYLKNMLLSEEADNLLPDWAFFVKAVVNVDKLRPTASRESFYEDARLEKTRDELGECLRSFLINLAESDERRLEQILSVHHLAIKALAVEDDEVFRTFADWLPFETTQGRQTLGQIRAREPKVRYVREVGHFHQMSRVASAQGMTLVNAGYVYESDLLAKLPEHFPDTEVESVEPTDLAQDFEVLSSDEQDAAQALLDVASRVLRPYQCDPDVRRFQPAEVAAVYAAGAEARFHRSIEQAQETADPLFAGVLQSLGKRSRGGERASLCLNYANDLVRQLAKLDDSPAVRHSVEILYVQSLLMAQQPLTARELELLSQSMTGLVRAAVRTQDDSE